MKLARAHDGVPHPRPGQAPGREDQRMRNAATPPLDATRTSSIPAAPRLRTVVILHMFSGRRRQGGVEEQLRYRAVWDDVQLMVLSLDIVNGPQGDLRSWQNLLTWVRHVLDGRVLAAIAGPPCESWSPARVHGRGPGLLRSQAHLWGFAALLPAEAQQVALGSDLLQAALLAFAAAWAAQAAAILEHPAKPRWHPQAQGLPSIWDLPETQAILSKPGVGTTTFDQCVRGAEGRKPTTLMHTGVPALRPRLLSRGWGGSVPA